MRSPHTRAVLLALFVTFLWSTSWILIKTGLNDIPALTFAGLRYTLAWLVLLPIAARRGALRELRTLSRGHWRGLIVLGLLVYALTQGTQFLALDRLPAITLTLLLNFTSVLVALLGIVLLSERPTSGQWVGIAVYLTGVVVYFYPTMPSGALIGLVFAGLCVLGNALGTIAGRSVNRPSDGGIALSPLAVTVASMGVGAPVMLVLGLLTQSFPQITLQGVAIVLWLAVVNTALAFTLWNLTQRTLSAVESSVINNTMLIQIAVLAWLFLGETLDARAIIGLVLAGAGSLIVQLRRAA